MNEQIIKLLQRYTQEEWYNNSIKNVTINLDSLISELKNAQEILSHKILDINLSNNTENDIIINTLLEDIKVIKQIILLLSDIYESVIITNTEDRNRNNDFSVIDEKIKVYISNDDLCTKCNTKLIRFPIDFKQIDNDIVNAKILDGFKCPCCDRLFVLDSEVDKDSLNNSNINLINDFANRTIIHELNFNDIIVLSTIKMCMSKKHTLIDVIAKIPVFLSSGEVNFIKINISYCEECKRYVMLENDFKKIKDIIACRVIDKRLKTTIKNNIDDEIEIKQKESILYQYGYNVSAKSNLSSKQRHLILASVVESNILTREQICSHLDTLIERGNKIEKWESATQKWKQDRHFVKKYNVNNLPSVLFNKIVLKYRQLSMNV